MPYPRVTIQEFRGGLNTKDLPTRIVGYTGGVNSGDSSMMQFPVIKGFLIDQVGRLVVRQGQATLIPSQVSAPHGFTHFVSDTVDMLMFAVAGTIYACATDGTGIITVDTGWDGSKDVNFETIYSYVYFVDGTHRARKWIGTGPAQDMGIDAPTVKPDVVGGTAGNLDSSGSGSSPYQWWQTFVNSDGLESNPSPVTDPLDLTMQSADLYDLPVSTDPQVLTKRLYRFGGTVTTRRFVAEIANAVTTYNDNTADIDLSLTVLSFAHDVPPTGVSFLLQHKNRLLAAGDPDHPSRLYISTYAAPEYWPTILENPDVDGGFFDVSPSKGDIIVGLGSNGSTALVLNKSSVFALFGDSFAQGGDGFAIRKISKIGCASRRSVTTCVDTVLFVGSDSQVWAIQDTTPVVISKDIRPTLRQVGSADLANSSGVYFDNRWYLFIPRAEASDIALVYDFQTATWSNLSCTELAFTHAQTTLEQGFDGNIWGATKIGYIIDGAVYNGIVSAFAVEQTSSNIPVQWTSPDLQQELRDFTNTARHLQIIGSYVPSDPGVPLRARVIAKNDSVADIVHSYPFTRTSGKLLDTELHSDLVGIKLTVEIFGIVDSGSINLIELQYSTDVREGA